MTRFVGLGRTEVTVIDELSPLEGYRDAMLASVETLPPETVALTDAVGRVLAEDVSSAIALPSFPNSAMDGYAVRAGDVGEASGDAPATLEVIGEVAAGAADSPQVRPGTAVRIMTGAPVPPGADTVIPVEVTAASGTSVSIHRRPEPGEHIRDVGEDVREGQTVATAGAVIGAATLALLAAVGRADVRCHRRARVAVVSTGDELVPVGGDLLPGQLHDSNGPMLTALAAREGAIARHVGAVRDAPDTLRETLRTAAEDADLVLVSGGVSAGAHDHLPDVLAELGSYERAQLAMKPGKPQARGSVTIDGPPTREVTVLGLPGNPVSSYVSFELFALPAIHRLQGRAVLGRSSVIATASEDLRGAPGKRTFLRVRLETDGDATMATPTGGQGSHVLSALATADGLAVVGEDRGVIPAGQPVRVHVLGRP